MPPGRVKIVYSFHELVTTPFGDEINAALLASRPYSFHADSATVETDTYLCTYFGPSSEVVLNEEVRRRVDVPETRAELLQLYGGLDDADFVE